MRVEIVQEPVASLAAYAAIPISFLIDRVVDVAPQQDGADRFDLRERPVSNPYVKDYDALDGGGPLGWPARFDVTRWVLLAAFVDGSRVGGAAVALDTPELTGNRRDLAVLWDLRIAPPARFRGVGSALFRAAEACAAARDCRQLLAETQNVNVPACRFYARHGCVLRAAHRFAYPGLPDEVQLLWYKDL